MAGNLADFYTGSMAPPDRMPDGSLKPSIATPQMSIADMYKGIYQTGAPAARPNVTAEGLNVRGVTTKDIVIGPNGFPVATGPKPEPAPVVQNGYDSGYVKTNTDRLPVGGPPALAAIETAAPAKRNLFAEAGYVAKPRFASSVTAPGGGIAGMFAPDVAANDPWGDKLRGPSGSATAQRPGYAYGRPATAAPAPAKPASLLETIASVFSPPTAPTYTTTPFQEDRFQTTTGAQMPSSMNNSRWTTGY